MYLTAEQTCDVLVVGAGIAGISAALEAAEAGRSVILTSSAHIFSGSSFYPGTWGLGLIGPADDGDREGRTGVPGLYACGKVTGGMHRADRIGGLSRGGPGPGGSEPDGHGGRASFPFEREVRLCR